MNRVQMHNFSKITSYVKNVKCKLGVYKCFITRKLQVRIYNMNIIVCINIPNCEREFGRVSTTKMHWNSKWVCAMWMLYYDCKVDVFSIKTNYHSYISWGDCACIHSIYNCITLAYNYNYSLDVIIISGLKCSTAASMLVDKNLLSYLNLKIDICVLFI